jgi:uncharacterized membrane protein YdbT with pleckstrin-like domain
MIRNFFKVMNETTSHFEGQEAGEKVVLLMRRHPFTIIYPAGFLALFGIVPIVAWLAFANEITSFGLNSLFIFVSSLWYLFLWLFLFYLFTLYSLNTVIVTDRRIIENEQHGFFHRKVSELHTNRVQDVSVRTHGILETFIGFGDIVVQTAASEREFVFHRIGNPEMVKDKIMQVVAAQHSKPPLN